MKAKKLIKGLQATNFSDRVTISKEDNLHMDELYSDFLEDKDIPSYLLIADITKTFIGEDELVIVIKQGTEGVLNCNHKDDKGNYALGYENSYEMRSSDMYCSQCNANGSRAELKGETNL